MFSIETLGKRLFQAQVYSYLLQEKSRIFVY